MGAESKHTPWSASDVCRRHDDGSTEVIRHAIRDARGQEVVTDVETVETRDLIVRAVNTHEEMLEALKAIVAATQSSVPDAEAAGRASEIALAAIANAECAS